MKLFVTDNSPYARITRILVLEKGLAERVEMVPAQTRVADSPYYAINPSGRVPFLLTPEGRGFEEAALICAYLDHIDGAPAFALPSGAAAWEARRLEALAHSLIAGVAVWTREFYRPAAERSPTIIEHERQRAIRLSDHWEGEIAQAWMQGPLTLAQIALVCALQLEIRNPDFEWRAGRPALAAWCDRLARRPSIAATVPAPL